VPQNGWKRVERKPSRVRSLDEDMNEGEEVGRDGERDGESVGEIVEPPPMTLSQSLAYCMRLLAQRARTRREIHDKLLARGVDEATAQLAIEWLIDRKFLDDVAIAERMVETQGAGQGKRKLALNLKRRGIDDETAVDALSARSDDDETAGALTTARRRVGENPADRSPQARKRLMDYLMRRGFAYGAVRNALNAIYSNSANEPGEDAD
jgi:SOS response regulatory protein OraA/RecX